MHNPNFYLTRSLCFAGVLLHTELWMCDSQPFKKHTNEPSYTENQHMYERNSVIRSVLPVHTIELRHYI